MKDNPIISSKSRVPNSAILLAAGFGKRFLPITETIPKPLVKIGGNPLLLYSINALLYGNIKTIYIVTNYLEKQIFDYCNQLNKFDFNIIFCHQKTINGTATAVKSVLPYYDDIKNESDFIIISGTDYIYPVNYISNLINFHKTNYVDISVSMRIIDKNIAKNCSQIRMGIDGRIERINEKPNYLISNDIIGATLLYIVPITIFKYLNLTKVSSHGEYDLTDVINLMIMNGNSASGIVQESNIYV